jgi:lipoprotein-anchoring transpeptidase ErfK/SrfK
MSRRTLIVAVLGACLVAGACSRTAPAPSPTVAVTPLPTASPSLSAPVGSAPVLGDGTFVARAKTASLLVNRQPFNSARIQWPFPAKNDFGQQVSFLVTGAHRTPAGDPWLHIQLGSKPNEAAAWVPQDEVTLSKVRDSIVVDLSQRVLRHYRDGKLVDRFSVGVGQPQWPTTPGHYFIWAKVPQASPLGPYGVYALGLSGFSTVLTDWPGGGRMAIHGTANASDQGQQVSHGCVRVYNPDMEKLKRLPMGTPVTIQK